MNGAGGWALDVLGLSLMAGVPGYFILQAVLLFWLRGGWRRAAAAPLVPMAAVLAYTVWAFAQGSNLFPIVLIFTSPLAFAYLIAVLAAHHAVRKPA
jgi:hypothetical protein